MDQSRISNGDYGDQKVHHTIQPPMSQSLAITDNCHIGTHLAKRRPRSELCDITKHDGLLPKYVPSRRTTGMRALHCLATLRKK
jgi:hypothetical protein